MLRARHTGWLGIDVGFGSVKIAQAMRCSEGVQLVARAMVARNCVESRPVPDHEQQSAAACVLDSAYGEIRAGLQLNERFSGRNAATAMSLAACDVYQSDQPLRSAENLESYVRKVIASVTPMAAEDLCFDLWPAETPASSDGERWNILAVGRSLSDGAYHDIVRNRLACKTIDSTPHALARALRFGNSKHSEGAVAALDWGHRQASLTVVSEGQPVYVRVLKNCGLLRTIEAVANSLEIPLEEARSMIASRGIEASPASDSLPEAKVLSELAADSLRQLGREICRTLHYLRNLRRSIIPRELFVFGGGGLIHGLGDALSARVELPTRVWSLGDESGHESSAPELRDCLFGAALGLSTLAWEK